MHSDEWLLAYEANRQAWLPTVGAGDHVYADPAFKILKQNGVSFYERGVSPFLAGALAYP
ncbi:MAG: hypothetical protein ACRD22_05300 [Terriglobia bacterium]